MNISETQCRLRCVDRDAISSILLSARFYRKKLLKLSSSGNSGLP